MVYDFCQYRDRNKVEEKYGEGEGEEEVERVEKREERLINKKCVTMIRDDACMLVCVCVCARVSERIRCSNVSRKTGLFTSSCATS